MNQRAFFDWLATHKLYITQPTDWYAISPEIVKQNHGVTLLNKYYSNSLTRAITTLYCEYSLLPWLFIHTSSDFWSDFNNHRLLFNYIAKVYRIQKTEDWYNITTSQVEDEGGSGLLKGHYNNSISRALESVYPDYNWQRWRFRKVAQEYWNDRNHHRAFFEWLAGELYVDTFDGWYRVSSDQVNHKGVCISSYI